MTRDIRTIAHPSFLGRIGVARRDITPPIGIYCRMWGSALHDVAEGIHRPLYTTAVAIQPESGGPPRVLIALDGTWWRSEEDLRFIRDPLLRELQLDDAQLMLHLSHTHAGPSISLSTADRPGGDKVRPYMERLGRACIEAARQALVTACPAVLEWAAGRCSLAANRVLQGPGHTGSIVGYNPHTAADDTLLVGRITDLSRGRVTATLVNYACHPTTLGGANRLISPDYIGAMRQVVETELCEAPCIFLLGACGELAPRRQYVGDPAIADQHGRQLGHAVLAVLHHMLPPGHGLAFSGIERSGTELGRWDPAQMRAPRTLESLRFDVHPPVRQLPSAQQIARKLAGCDDRVESERLERAAMLRGRPGEGDSFPLGVWLWRIGDAIFLGTPAEAGSALQVHLRRRFPHAALAIMNIVNGYAGYLPPRQEYALETYQARISLFERGGLEMLIERCAEVLVQGLEARWPADDGRTLRL